MCLIKILFFSNLSHEKYGVSIKVQVAKVPNTIQVVLSFLFLQFAIRVL